MMVEFNGEGAGGSGSKDRPEGASGGTNKKREPEPRMAPILSRRSIIALTIGLILGVGLGIGYWILSPALGDLTSDIQEVSTRPTEGPYECISSIQVVQPGSSYVSVKELQYQGEYYAAKANTLPFLEFLSQQLTDKAPDYAYSAEELDTMIDIGYDWNNENPGIIAISVTGSTDHEALYMAGLIPHEFRNFLIAEETRIEQQEYESTLANIEIVKIALFDAEKELADVILAGDIYDINSDPNYVALRATITALETELENQTAELALYIALGDTSQDYLDKVTIVERTSNALAEARKSLTTLETENSVTYFTENREYNVAKARVDSLSMQLSDLTMRLGQYFTANADEPSEIDYLIVGTASQPTPIPPERIRGRNAAIIGGICGMGIAWVTINRKWIVKQLSSPGADATDDITANEV